MLAKLFKFYGGVKPPSNKTLSNQQPIRPAPLPSRLVVPLHQHIGGTPRPLVRAGDPVLKGQKIGEADGWISAAVHAPTSGTVVEVAMHVRPHVSGLESLCVVIEPDGKDEWITHGPADRAAMSPADICQFLQEHGIVGLGGAGFPTHGKLKATPGVPMAELIINAAECEPYITCDDLLMRERADDVVRGIAVFRDMLQPTQVIIGVEDNKPEAIAAMLAAAAGVAEVHIRPIPARYPMGSEKQLVQVLTGKEVAAESRTFDIGILVHNVGTALAVRAAIRDGRPLISRVVTVNGNCANDPGNIEVLVGTLAEEVIAFAGGLKGDGIGLARRVMGGPMMGMQIPHWRVPVVKGTSGILAFDAQEVAAQEPDPCIRCGSCVKACPMGLLPLEMSARIRNSAYDEAVGIGLKDCIACGCCAYVCPSKIPLVQYFVHAKGELAAQDRNKLRNDATKKLAQQRQERLDREAREKAEAAAKRKAEREAAAAAKAAAEAAAKQASETAGATEGESA